MCFSVLHRLRIIDFKSRRVSARGVMFFAAAAQPQCGYDNWAAGDRVMLTTVSGEGFMFNEDERTQVDIFPWNP